jgi:uncharacterized protein (TIGR02466 family)
MIKEQFFPTPIYAKDIEIDNDLLTNYIINWSKTDKGVNKTNKNGWHSDNIKNTQTEFTPLVTELFNMQKEIYQEEFLERQPAIGNIWANLNPPGGYNKPHIHPNALWSGVYYVKGSEKSGNLICSDPRPGVQMVMPARKKTQLPKHLWNECHLAPLVGRIIMFPAWLWHEVQPNNSEDIRISISFNFVQEGFRV